MLVIPVPMLTENQEGVKLRTIDRQPCRRRAQMAASHAPPSPEGSVGVLEQSSWQAM